MTITIQQFDGPPVFIVTRVCLSMPEARAAESALKAMPEPGAYLPDPPPTAEAPPLSPDKAAMQERAEAADDPHVGDLKAGEAVNG
jgi:hypothetical protein